MPRLYLSSIVDAPVERVWPVLRDFGGLAAYYPALDELALNGLAGDQIGCTRTLTLKSGVVVRERLIALSDEEHSGSYSVAAEGPFENVVSSYRLRPVTDRNATFLEWITTFDAPDPTSASGLLHFLEHEVYGSCFRGIAALVEKRSLDANKAAVLAFLKALRVRDWPAARAQLCDDASHWIAGLGTREPADAYIESASEFFAQVVGDMTHHIDEVVAEGDKVVVELRSSAQFENGRQFDNTYLILFYLRGGKIARIREHMDTVQLAALFKPLPS